MDVQLASGSAEIEAPEVDAEYLTLNAPQQGVTLRLSEPLQLEDARRGSGGNLFCISNTFGWAVAGTNSGFSLFALKTLQSSVASASPHTTPAPAPHITVPSSNGARVDFLRFAMSEKIVLAGLSDGTIAVWRLQSLVNGSTAPSHVFPSLGAPLIDLLPNPAPSSPLIAVLPSAPGAPLVMLNLDSLSASPLPSITGATSASWSVKGKQISIGLNGGAIGQFTPEGQQKGQLELPSALGGMGGAWEVKSLSWLENTVWLAIYGRPSNGGAPTHEDEVYVLTKKPSGEVEASRFMDPCPAFGMMSREGRRWVGRFRNWSPFHHLLFLANSPSGDIGVISQSTSDNTWSSLALPDTSRPSLPLGPESEDVCPLGLELDLTPADGESGPRVLVYTSQGVLVVWRVQNEMASKGSGAEGYSGMRRAVKDVLTQEAEADNLDEVGSSGAAAAAPQEESMSITPAPSTTPTPFGAPSSSPFATGGTASAFGAPSSSPFAVSTPASSTAPSSGFGAPAFGTSGFGAPAFGAKPAFGASSFGSSPFGTPASTAGAAATPSAFTAPKAGGFAGFGASSAASPFASAAAASSPFASASSTPTITATATAPSAFSAPKAGGFSAFGSTGGFGSAAASTPNAATASPFGSGSTFGAAPAFGKSAFSSTATPAFGTSPFAASAATPSTPVSAPATNTAPATSGGFTSTGLSGFAGFGSAAVAAAKSSSPAASPSAGAAGSLAGGAFGSASAGGGFGAFGGSTSGASAFSSVPASSSPFGAGGSAFASTTPKPSTPTTSAFASGGSAFGAGGVSKFVSPSASPSPASPTSKTKAFSSTSRFASSSDSEDEGDKEPEEEGRRVDEPPDLEPTVTGLDLGQSMKEAKSSTEGPKSGASAFSAAGGLGFGGLGFGTTPATSTASTSSAAPLGTSIFGSAAPAVKSPPAGGFGGFGSALKGATSSTGAGFGFNFGGAPAAKTEPKEEKKDEPLKPDVIEEPKADTAAEETKPRPTPSLPALPAPGDDKPGNESENKIEVKEEASPTPVSTTEPKKDDSTPAATTKSLFGFSSSPPTTPSAGNSLLSKVELAHDEEGEDEEEEEEEEDYDEEGEEEEANEDEDGEEYDDEEEGDEYDPQEDQVHYEGESEDDQDQADDAATLNKGEASVTPSLLSRLSPAPPSPSPSPSPSPAPPAAPEKPSPPAFSSASATPATSAPASLPFSFTPAPTPTVKVEEIKSSDTPPKEAANPSFGGFGSFSTPPTASSSGGPGFSFASTAPASAPKSAVVPSASSEGSKSPFGGFFGFGSKPAADNTKPPATATGSAVEATKEESVKPAFPSFGAPPSTGASSPSTIATEQSKPSLPSFTGFGSPSTTPPASSTPPPALAAAKTPASFFNMKSSAPRSSSPLSAAPATSSFLAPVGAPTVAARPTSPLAFVSSSSSPFSLSANVPAAATKTPLPPSAPQSPAPSSFAGGFSGFGSTAAPSAPAIKTPSLPSAAPSTPQAPPARTGPSLSATTTPKLGSQLVKAESPKVQETGMAGEFLKAFLRVEKDFEILRDNAVIFKKFVKDIGEPYQTPEQPINYDDKYWSLGDIGRLRELTKKVEPSVSALVEKAQQQKRQAAELQSLMLKAETKREEAARFIRAQSDPVFAKMVRVRQLGPEQVENQKKIRHAMEAVRGRVEQLEDHVIALKDKIVEDRLGRSTFKAPSLDTVNRAIRNVSNAVADKTLELDDLDQRLSLLRLAPSSKSSLAVSARHRSPSVAEESLSTSIFRASPRGKAQEAHSTDVVRTAKAALEAERRARLLKSAALSTRSTPLINKQPETVQLSATAPIRRDLGDLQLAFSRGPITGDRLPLPRRPPPPFHDASLSQPPPIAQFGAPLPFSASPAPSWSMPSTLSASAPDAPPPLTFKAPVSFSFATPPAASPSTASSPGIQAASRTRESTRSHSSAVKLRPSSGSSASSTPSADVTSFWGVPKSTTVPSQVPGFVSFSSPSIQTANSRPSSGPSNGFGFSQDDSADDDDEEEEDEESYEGEEGDEWDEEGLETLNEEDEE